MTTSSPSDTAHRINQTADLLRSSHSAAEYGLALVSLTLMRRLAPEALTLLAGREAEAAIADCPTPIREVLEDLGFPRLMERLQQGDILGPLVAAFQDIDLDRETIDTPTMSQLFAEVLDGLAGVERGGPEHHTPLGVCKLLSALAVGGGSVLAEPSIVYDPACGAGRLLETTVDRIGAPARVVATELNQTAAALCKARSLIREETWEVIAANSLATDRHQGVRASVLVCNPPFGLQWKAYAQPIRDEHALGSGGRYGLGLPRISDSTFLFLQDLLGKMRSPSEGGARAVLLSAGSPLWSGTGGSAESHIRRFLFERDLLEAVVVLPAQVFPHTGIQTYAWVLSNCKSESARGRVRLIDGSDFSSPGGRRLPRRIEPDHVSALVRLLNEDDPDLVRVFRNGDFDAEHGHAIERVRHLGFGLDRELAKVAAQYETCSLRPLGEVSKIRRRRRTKPPERREPSTLGPSPFLRDVDIEPDPEVLTTEYLAMFFSSDLGDRLLKALAMGTVLPRLNLRDLEQLSVPVPTLDEQGAILETRHRIDELADILARIERELAANPRNVSVVNAQVIPMLQALGQLSDADEVRERVRAGESKRVEFKQTFSLDVRKDEKAKYIEESALKTIVAFLNSDGGDLLVGVADDGTIPGLGPEVERFFGKSADKFLLHVKNRVKTRIGEQYYPLIDQRLVNVGDQLVLWVSCAQSDQPVFLDEEMFFVRTNPATDKLTGRKMAEYIRTRFE